MGVDVREVESVNMKKKKQNQNLAANENLTQNGNGVLAEVYLSAFFMFGWLNTYIPFFISNMGIFSDIPKVEFAT